MLELPTSRALGAGALASAALKLLRRDLPVPLPVGLEREGNVLLGSFPPPSYPDMAAAVRGFLDLKYSPTTGAFRDRTDVAPWRDVAAVQAGIPEYSDRTIPAAIAYCQYVHQRYGRFPAYYPPFRAVVAHQAHHLDLEFYDRFYKAGMVPEAHRRHRDVWHAA